MTPEQNWWNIHRSEGILNIRRMAGVCFLLQSHWAVTGIYHYARLRCTQPQSDLHQDRVTAISLVNICHLIRGFPGGSAVKNLPASAGDLGLIPGSGRSPREGTGNPLQYSCLGNPMDRGACSLAGYSSWGHKRVRHDLATKQWQPSHINTK